MTPFPKPIGASIQRRITLHAIRKAAVGVAILGSMFAGGALGGALLSGGPASAQTDAEGAAYEAHMTKPDGSHVTVKVNEDFSVAEVVDGNG